MNAQIQKRPQRGHQQVSGLIFGILIVLVGSV